MAKEKPLEDGPGTEFGAEFGADFAPGPDIDQQVGDLRDVLKNAGDEASAANGEESGMGGAEALQSDFGADFGADFAGGSEAAAAAGPDVPGMDLAAAGGDFGAELGLDAGSTGFTDMAGGAAATGASGETMRMDIVLDIPVDVQIILGTCRMAVSTLMELTEGATIGLDRKIGEPVDITVNGKAIGRGEITVLESDETRFGIRMIEVFGKRAKED